MAVPLLDLPTVFVMTAVVIAFSGLLLILLRGKDHNAVPLGLWGCSLASGAAGLLAYALSPVLGALADAIGGAAIVLGSALSWTAARIFSGRKAAWGIGFVGVLIASVANLLPPVMPGLQGAAASVIGSCFTFAAAAELARDQQETLRSRNPAIILLILHGTVYLVRGGLPLFDPVAYRVLPDGVVLVLMFEALLHTLAMAFLLLSLIKDRTELQSTSRFRHLALVDELTSLGNRRQFDEALNREYRRATRDVYPLALLMIDADNFKAFNDRYGHQAGDECLKAIAGVIRSSVHRPGDKATRYGGEEFAIVLPETDLGGAILVAEQIHEGIAALDIRHEATAHGQVSVSIGIAIATPGRGLPSGRKKLIRAADHALYAAKAKGRNVTAIHQADAGFAG